MQAVSTGITTNRISTDTNSEPIEQRVAAIEYPQLLHTLNDLLSEFAHAIGAEQVHDIEITGVVIVGSYLTAAFEPAESDLDIITVLNEEFAAFDGFSRAVRDAGKRLCRGLFHGFDTTPVRFVDPVAQATVESVDEVAREPNFEVLEVAQ